MEVNCSQIEFGNFEKKMAQMYIDDSCVEFPPSWPATDKTLKLSFMGDIIDENKEPAVTKVSANAGLKTALTDCATTKEPQSGVVICNGTAEVVNAATEKVYENKNTSTCKRTDSDQVNGKTANEDEDLIINVQKEDMKNKTIEVAVSNGDTVGNNMQTSNDTPLNSQDNKDLKDASNDEKRDVDKKSNEYSQNNEDTQRTNENVNDSTNELLVNGSSESETSKNEQLEPKTQQTSWAGLFRDTNAKPAASRVVRGGENATNGHSNSAYKAGQDNGEKRTRPGRGREKIEMKLIKIEDDPHAKVLAEKLIKMELIFKPQAFIPRGLTNTSNWCYVNATLQALLVCPPFYQLLKSLPTETEMRKETSTPITDSFIQLASEFRPLSTKRGYQLSKDIRHGSPFQPTYIYDMLSIIKSSLSERGSQEDAEEFQSCVLNGLHEEMTRLFNQLNNSGMPSIKQENHKDMSDEMMINGDDDADNDEWEEVLTTKKNRSAVTRRADVSKTPISDMFRGELCTCVFRPGQKVSISFEPFFSLPLDVPMQRTSSIEDALCSLTDKEQFVEKENDSGSTRQQTIEVLPPVLILHLKRFVYDKNGGSKKIDKKVEYKTDLVIPKERLSKSAARKHSVAQRSYKLFAVVYHHGEKATGGHYTTDVFHIGMSTWLRIDDQSIWPVPHNEVTRHNSNRTAYLLYYRRTDLG